MTQKKDNSTQKKHRSPWHWVFFIFCGLLVIFLLASYLLRTSLYLKARLTPKLAEVGTMIHGHFEFEDVEAMGVTGLVLKNVKFTPAQPGIEPLTFEAVTIYPQLLGMFVGDLNASLVEIQGLNARLNLSDDNSPDIKWLKTLAERSAEPSSVIIDDLTNTNEIMTHLPTLKCEQCHVDVSLPKGMQAKIHVTEQNAELISKENWQIAFDGAPMKICANTPNIAESCFQFSLDTVSFENGLYISQVEIKHLKTMGIDINSVLLRGISAARNETRNALFVESGNFDGTILDASVLDAFSGNYLFEFLQLEILHEREKDRIGIGVQIRESNAATARIYGGYDINAQKIALTFDTSKFDFSRFTQKADFSKYLRLDSFPISGHVSTIIELDKKRAWFDIDAKLTDGIIYASMLSRDIISNIDATLAMRAWGDLSERTFAVEYAEGKLGNIPFNAGLNRSKKEDGTYRFDAFIKSTGESADFIPSLPTGFAPAITGYQLAGPYDFRIGLSYDENNLDALLLDVNFNLDQVQTIAFDPRSNFELLKGDAFMIQIKAATVPIQIGPRDPKWVTFYDLPRDTAYAFVASEDGKFFTHPGFDIKAIRASLIADLKADKIVRGGSTISQQVVKNLFLNHDKTASRKFQEAFLTWQMEKTLPKIRIFEFYLNLAHWAKDTYGIRAAAEFYFQKNIKDLTLRESLFLASILPNPIIFGRQYAENRLSSSRLTKMINVGNALKATKRIDAATWEAAIPLIREGKISDKPRPVIPPETK